MVEAVISSLFCLFIALILATMAFGGISFAPWVPCKKSDQKRIFDLAGLKAGDIFYDLGCGDGRQVFYAAKNFQAKAVGLEIGLPMYTFCILRQKLGKYANTTFKYKNLFKEKLSDADVVYFFGMPDTIKNKLAEKLKSEMKPGSRIISYAFHVPGLTPAIVDKPTPKSISVFCYKM